jgi:uncharacterized protein with PIN domain
MLGSLAKWLRIFGYDTTYEKVANDAQIIKKAKKEGRIVVTRDKELFRRCTHAIILENDGIEAQLKKIFRDANIVIKKDMILTRCTVCNTLIDSVKKEKIKGKVPPHAYEVQDEFWVCRTCNRIYWMGTHWVAMKEMIKRVARSP